MKSRDRSSYSEDMFADTRMSFGDHLEDLRVHLWRAVVGFLFALIIGFFLGKPLLDFINAPVEREVNAFYDERVRSKAEELDKGTDPALNELNEPHEGNMEFRRSDLEALGLKPPNDSDTGEWVKLDVRYRPLSWAITLSRALRPLSRRPGLSTLSPQESFMAFIKVSFVCGLVIGSPWIFWQIWSFIAAGLYPNEKRLVNVYLPISLLLFLTGVLVCQFMVIPKALQALLWFNHWLNLEPDFRFSEWLGFAILLPVVFGVSFQLPMIMMFLERIGILSVDTYWKNWRMAIFIIHVFAAAITPVDIFSMESLALAMCALYGFGIFLCRFNPARKESEDLEESEEMVGV